MAAEYEPGTVAVATVCGVPNVRVMRVESNYAPTIEWASAQGEKHRMHEPREVTDVRPLVVLDLVNAEQTIKTLRIKANDCGIYQAGVLSELADQIEAQTKPKRIPEPGLWGVVEAAANGGAERGQFVHTPKFWYCAEFDHARGWDALIDPTLIREGVES